MELKVWVDGIQRIVCGVNEKTTCQDVVFALAHATGKTGRFTLIERWRNSERLLAPSEQPLKVLLKWGEHSNDVQFILQWSPLESTTINPSIKSGQIQSAKVHGVESSCSDSSTHSPSPLSKSNYQFTGSPMSGGSGTVQTTLQANGSKKPPNSICSMSQSDAKQWGSFGQSDPRSSPGMHTPMEEPTNGSIRSPQSIPGMTRSITQPADGQSPSGKQISGPPPYREPPCPASMQHNSTSPLVTTPTAGCSPAMKCLPPYRDPPPPHLPIASNFVSRTTSGGSPASSVTITGNQFINGPLNAGPVNGCANGFSQNELLKFSSHPSHQDTVSACNSSSELDNRNPMDRGPLNGGVTSIQSRPLHKVSPQSSNSNSHYQELIRIVNSQREKLTSQQAELTQYDAEIMFWEGKSREQQKHIDLINKEISRLELVSSQHESQASSLAHLEEEHEYTQHESVVLRTEMNSLRLELEKCDQEIEDCKKRIRFLVEELHATQAEMAQRQQEWVDKETAALVEMEKIRAELDITRRETEATQEMSGSLDQEVQSIEASLSEKKKHMERLVAAMKEANLQSLSIQPPEDLIEVHHRSGSTRRMIGSPRQLENAAPTSKNPHGVWV